jgi:hypothetical protein
MPSSSLASSILLCVSLAVPAAALANADGSPLCMHAASDMETAETTTAPVQEWSLSASVAAYTPGVPFTVTLSHPMNRTFKGLSLTARAGPSTVGTWTSTGTWKPLAACPSSRGLTHRTAAAKTSPSTFTYTPPVTASGTIRFYAAVVEFRVSPANGRWDFVTLDVPLDMVATTTELSTSGSPSDQGGTVTFTAAISPAAAPAPTGTVEFRAGGEVIAGCAAVPVAAAGAQCATKSLQPGVRLVTATYSGDAAHGPSTSNEVAQNVRYVYNFALEPQQETPPLATPGYGTARVTVDVVANQLAYDIRFANLSSPEIMAHIHGYALRGTPAGIVFDLGTGNPKTGVWNFSESDKAPILSGQAYVNIHSASHGGGEIRGQIDNAGSVAARRHDFTRDGRPDLLWRHAASGSTYLWRMDGTALAQDQFVANVDGTWFVIGTGDFNGDGHNDIVWRNQSTGQASVWYLVDGAYQSDASPFTADPEWKFVSVADFNNDGKPDFLFRNAVSGLGFVWYFNDTTPVSDQFLYSIAGNWIVENGGDFNGDGYPDFFFRNTDPASGLGFVWLWDGTSLGASYFLFSIDPHWQVVQIADWNRDGFVDLVFRDDRTGLVFVWYTDGASLQGSDFIVQIDPSWELVPHP